MFKSINHEINGSIKGFVDDLNKYFSEIYYDGYFYKISKQNQLLLIENYDDYNETIIASKFVLPIDIKADDECILLSYYIAGRYEKRPYFIKWIRGVYPARDILKKLMSNNIEIQDQDTLLNALGQMLCYIEIVSQTKAIGWHQANQKLDYIGITLPSYNLDFNVFNHQRKFNSKEAYKESLKLLEIENESITYPLFSNVLLSFASILIKDKHKSGRPMFLNVSGKANNVFSSRSLVNILVNPYSHSNMSLNSFPASCIKLFNNNSKTEIRQFISSYNDCPLIINESVNIDYIFDMIYKEKTSAFPIFISSNPIRNKDYIYSINIEYYKSNATESDLEMARRAIPLWHHSLIDFVFYIIKACRGLLSTADDILDVKLKKVRQIYKACKRKTTPIQDMREEDWVEPCVNLNFAFHLFIQFGRDSGWIDAPYSDKLTETATTIFKKMATVPDQFLPVNLVDNQNYEAFRDYLQEIFVEQSHVPDFDYWANLWCDGDDEPCLYLDYNKYFADFNSIKNIYPTVDRKVKRNFEKILIAKQWIKPQDNTTLSMMRTNPKTKGENNGKAKSVKSLVIFQEKIIRGPFISDGNQSPKVQS